MAKSTKEIKALTEQAVEQFDLARENDKQYDAGFTDRDLYEQWFALESLRHVILTEREYYSMRDQMAGNRF